MQSLQKLTKSKFIIGSILRNVHSCFPYVPNRIPRPVDYISNASVNFIRKNRIPNVQKRSIRSAQNLNNLHPKNQFPKTPDLIYFPHLIRWLTTKIRFKYLHHFWDPTFSEGAFIFGSTQAICRITEIIHRNQPEELDNLVTISTKAKLVEDMKKKLTDKQRQIILLTPDDIKILVPMSVHMIKSEKEKTCKIILRALALKWHPQQNGILRLVLVALQTDFLKTYNEEASKDWTISAFEVMECTTLTESPKAK